MIRIAAIALLYAAASLPAMAAEDDIYTPADTNAPSQPPLTMVKAQIERMCTFSLLETDGNFSLYGKLSIPRITTAQGVGPQPEAATYGLHGQFDRSARMGFKFGWDRYIAGQNAGNNLYSLSAVVRF